MPRIRATTLGMGLSLPHSSSLDLVVHRYRLEEPAARLRDAGVEAALTGIDTDVGREVPLVLAPEQCKRVEFELVGSAIRHGRAFGAAEGERSYRAFVGMRVAF